MSNADYIRGMNDEELARFLYDREICLALKGDVDCSNEKRCEGCFMRITEWLKKEREAE